MSLMFLLKTLAKISYSSHDSGSRILQVNTKGATSSSSGSSSSSSAASLSPAAAHTGHGF
jgi:hypothetical protein